MDREWLQREYVTNQRSMRSIAEEFGLHFSSIDRWLRMYRIPKRKRGFKGRRKAG